ncbi:RhoGAP domain-containing protein [Yersinia mollaretii]|nr:RhoGAP domain-containing protein [Yersinia mollaretii]QKJ02815.1 hypothetical protein HRD69_07255 [Yersinia mollaretii ATCC 43969]
MDKRIDNALFDDDITIKHDDVAMEKKGSFSIGGIIKSIKSITSFTSFITKSFRLFSAFSTNIENKAPPTDNKIEIQEKAVSNLTRLIDCTLNNESFLAKNGIFRIPPSPASNQSIQKALESNNEEQLTTLQIENDFHDAVATNIKDNLELALSDADKENLHEMVVAYDLTEADNKKEFLPKTSELPLPLQKLIPLLAKTTSNAKNQMDAINLAKIIAPRIQPESVLNHIISIAKVMENEKYYTSFLSDLINDYGK